MHYYNIIPFINLPLTKKPSFTYNSEQKFEFGAIVQIPFGKKTVLGVIIKKTARPPFPTKKILSTIGEKQIDKKQFSLAQFVSEYYFTPLGIALKFFFQKPTKKTSPPPTPKSVIAKTIQLTKQQKTAANKILCAKDSEFLLFGPASSGKTEVVISAIEEILKSTKKQVVVFVPEIFLAHQEFDRYYAKFKNFQVALYHSHLRPSENTYIKKEVKKGNIRIIITTRTGLFLPFKKLGLVAVDEEQDVSYKQWDQSPFYHTRAIAKELAKLHKATLVFMSSTPSLETYNKFLDEQNTSLLRLPLLKTKNISVTKPEIIISDLLENYKPKQRILISPLLKESLEKNLKANEISLVLVPRKGKSSYSFCKDCRKALFCPNCQTPLIHTGDNYRCIHCNYKKSVITKCENCGSFRIINTGMGTQSVSEELKKLLPSARIIVADSDTFQKKEKRESTYQNLKNNEADIAVGTYGVAKGFDFPHISLTAILNADNWSGQTNFSFDEHFLSSLFQLAGRVNRPASKQNGRCIIQTFHPGSKTFNILKKWNWEEFAHQELLLRKHLKYPPFSRLIRLTVSEDSLKKLEKTSDKVYNSLLKVDEKSMYLSKPYFGYVRRKNSKWKKYILIKSKIKLTPNLTSSLRKMLPQCKIDIDVENIF